MGAPPSTFAEQVHGLTKPLRATQHRGCRPAGGRASAGRPSGARLTGRLACAASKSTLMRLIRALPDPADPTPRVLGVDDFACAGARLRHDPDGHRDPAAGGHAARADRGVASAPGCVSIPASRSSAGTVPAPTPKAPHRGTAARDAGRRPLAVRHEAPCRIPGSAGMNSEGGSWVQWLTWIRKGEWDHSMPGKRRPCSGIGGGASRDPRDTAKAGLPESQSPEDGRSHPPERCLTPAPRPAPALMPWPGQPPGRGAMPSEGIQGDEWGAYITLVTYDKDEHGIAYGTRAPMATEAP